MSNFSDAPNSQNKGGYVVINGGGRGTGSQNNQNSLQPQKNAFLANSQNSAQVGQVVRATVLVVDTERDAEAARRGLWANAVTYSDVIGGRAPSLRGSQLMVLSQEAPLQKLHELIARGIAPADLRYVDLSSGDALADIVQHNVDRARWLLTTSLNVKSDRVRPLLAWAEKPAWEPLHINDETLSQYLRWRPRNLAVVVGDYGSGKSTFAQLLAAKLATGQTLWDSGGQISVCAWEDDREDFKNRMLRFATGGDPLTPGVDLTEPMKLLNRIHWFEPDEDPERLLDEYISNIEYLSLHENVRVHVADPWNSFSHLNDTESETRYVERMLNQLQVLTKKLDVTIIIVTHLPKSATSGRGDLKPFRVGDSSGSKHWGNKADTGFCVVRTNLLSAALDGDMPEESLKKIGLTPTLVEATNMTFPKFGDRPSEHMVVVSDKIKIEGMGPRQMGWKAIRAFSVDPVTRDIVLDEAATELAKSAWR